jgi:hypothetical protein
MSHPFARFLLPLGSAALLSLSVASPAQASEADAYYRCHVVGETAACSGLPAPTMGEMTVTKEVPGDYAHYLMYLGESPEKAIADAREVGEQPKVAAVEVDTPRHYSAAEQYERYLGM